MTDPELVELYQAGDEVAIAELIQRHRGLIRWFARKYYVPGAEQQDVEQEALIGFFRAAQGYRVGSQVAFITWAGNCMDRHLIAVLRAAHTQKRRALKDYAPLEDVVLASAPGPAEQVLAQESYQYTADRLLGHLSPLEREVIVLLAQGYKVAETAERLGSHHKAVDNARLRARSRIRKAAA